VDLLNENTRLDLSAAEWCLTILRSVFHSDVESNLFFENIGGGLVLIRGNYTKARKWASNGGFTAQWDKEEAEKRAIRKRRVWDRIDRFSAIFIGFALTTSGALMERFGW